MIGTSALSRLATLTGHPRSELRHLLNADEQAITVKLMTLSTAAGNRLSAAHLHGVLVVPSAHRRYPYGALLGPLLGWSGVASSEDMKRWPDVSLGEIVGRAGLEQQYDPILRGVDGQQCMYVDPPGTPVALGAITPPVPGADVRLTIDLGLQKRLDADLTNALSRGEQGATVALDPRNGQVLAMASRPSYDDNVFGPPVDDAALSRLDNASGNPMLEHATQVTAPAASTFKLVVAAADMVHRAVPPDDVIQTGSTLQLDGHTFHNWTDLPPQDLNQAIAWSNDVYFYRLAWALGAQSIISTARQLGVGQPTGIDLPGESAGYLGTPSSVVASGAKWYSGSTVLLGIGQGYLTVTPLQDARWTAGLATGALVTPHLGLSFGGGRRADTGLSWTAPRRLPFAAQLGPVRTGMRTAVTSGTATVLRSLPVAAGGKTGTAEDPSAGGAGLDSWLSAVAPMDHPTIAVTAFIRGTGNSHPSNEIVRSAMAYFFTHEKATLAH
jgi:cell division protein FtsI/penicillin-binding protein 2